MPIDVAFAVLEAVHVGFCYPPGNLLYALTRTGPVVPAHTGDDQEHDQLSGIL
jgi:hypothetical protein